MQIHIKNFNLFFDRISSKNWKKVTKICKILFINMISDTAISFPKVKSGGQTCDDADDQHTNA